MSSTFWDRYAAAGYDALPVLLPYEALQEAVLTAAAMRAGERLLVAGCGAGYLEWRAAQRLAGLRVDAADLSRAMLARAQRKCAKLPGVAHHLADLCRGLPFAEATFDAAIMCNVLYALPDGPAALGEIARVVRPGGRFVLCDRQPWSTVAPVRQAHFAALRALPMGARLARWARTLAALPALIAVAKANADIQARLRDGRYRAYTEEAIVGLLADLGFTVTGKQSAYADQCWLLQAVRQPAAADTRDAP